MKCESCGSTNIKNLGLRMMGNVRKYKYECNVCKHTQMSEESIVSHKKKLIPEVVEDTRSYVVTSATHGFPLNEKFYNTLLNYCKDTNSVFVILPVNNHSTFELESYDTDIQAYMVYRDIILGNDLVIKGATFLGTNLESPLRDLDSFSKGKSVIFGHPQVQLKTLPRKNDKYPPILATTGSVCDPDYNENKSAQKANFNHSHSALFISGGSKSRKLRHLNFDGQGFYDLDKYYTEDEIIVSNKISAIVTGDEHVVFYDADVFEATYGKQGVVNALKPDYIFRHDVLDCYSISHHHNNNHFLRWAKTVSDRNKIEDELLQTIDFITETTPEWATSVIIPSNHNSHLLRWLNEYNPKSGDLDNLKIYYKLSYEMLENATTENGVMKFPDPFEMYARNLVPDNVRFLSPKDDFLLHDIDLNNHGDLGVNGTRGTRLQYKNMPNKSVIGHSHSPGIDKGSYQVGTSSELNLEYNIGPSTWHQCHCIIYPNGKRQLLFIVDGEWR